LRVLLIHQAFCGPADPGGTRHYELGRRLVAAGHRLTVVTSRYSYLTGEQKCTAEDCGGIELRFAKSVPGLHRSNFWRLFVFTYFMMSSIVAGSRVGETDVILGTTPSIFQAVSAYVIAAVRGCRFVLEVRDLWPEFAIDLGLLRSPLLIWLARRLEAFLYMRADHIIVNSPAYREYLLGNGIADAKISLVANGVDTSLFDPAARGEAFRREQELGDKFVVMYAGALGFANDIDCLLRAASRFREDPGVVVVIVGDGRELPRLRVEADALNLNNVRFVAAQPKQRMAEILAAADVCVATLKNVPMFRTTYPNKVFDYMATGRPTILATDGVIRQVIENAGGGLVVAPGDDAALWNAIMQLRFSPELRREMGANARSYVTQHFDREAQGAHFVKVLESICLHRATVEKASIPAAEL